jgi:hypothetical protein
MVRRSGHLYERVAAAREHRHPQDLFHTALLIRYRGVTHSIEIAPAWQTPAADRGVVGTGPVGCVLLGRSRWFRYEVRRWANGRIPDLAEAVDSPVRVATDEDVAARILELVAEFPCRTWGRDEGGYGDMWNSNSLSSWVLASSGVDLSWLQPPRGGRAPGWQAGLSAARAHVSVPAQNLLSSRAIPSRQARGPHVRPRR